MTSPLESVDLPEVSDDGSTGSWKASPSDEYTFARNTVGALLLTGRIRSTKGSDAVTCEEGDTSILLSNKLEVARDDRPASTVMLVGDVFVKSPNYEGLALDVRFAVRDPFTPEELARSRTSCGLGSPDHMRHPVRIAISEAQCRDTASLTLTEHSCLLSAVMSGFGVVSQLEQLPNELLCGLSDAILNDKDSPPIVQAMLQSPEYTWEAISPSDSEGYDTDGSVLEGTQVEPAISQMVDVEIKMRLIDLSHEDSNL